MLWYRLVSLLLRLMDCYELLIVVDAILSWVPTKYGSTRESVKQAIKSLVNPFLDVFRRLIPQANMGGMYLDFSPVVAIIALRLIERLVVAILL